MGYNIQREYSTAVFFAKNNTLEEDKKQIKETINIITLLNE